MQRDKILSEIDCLRLEIFVRKKLEYFRQLSTAESTFGFSVECSSFLMVDHVYYHSYTNLSKESTNYESPHTELNRRV